MKWEGSLGYNQELLLLGHYCGVGLGILCSERGNWPEDKLSKNQDSLCFFL